MFSSLLAELPVTITMEPDPGFELSFERMSLTEELGRPFAATLDVISQKRSGPLSDLLGASVTVKTQIATGNPRYFNAIVIAAATTGAKDNAFRFRLELRPWIWLLSQVRDCAIFQNKTVWDIITGVLRDNGFTNFSDKRQNQSGSAQLEYCVQFEETTLDFVTRLMEKYGLYYFIEHHDGRHDVVFADDAGSHTALLLPVPCLVEQTAIEEDVDHVWNWEVDLALQSGKVTLRDYNFLTPSTDLTAKALGSATHPYGNLEVYDYPGPYAAAADGQKLATVRLQEIASRHEILRCESTSAKMGTGVKFTLGGNSDSSQNREYVVIASTLQIDLIEGWASTRNKQLDRIASQLTLIPAATPFRLDAITPWPRMRGPQTARVVGKEQQEITTDQYGRIKVKFFWDRSEAQDDTASCWIRVAQSWSGAGWGGMVIPRVGQEVVVDFIDGNPDRPLVTGCVYNATNTVPYALDANKTRSTFQTRSSADGGGGSGFNELRFEDKKDNEEVFLQAQKDLNVTVLNNETVTITQDFVTTVQKGKRDTTVSEGNDSLTVSKGDRSVTVSQGKDSLTVSQGDRSVTVSQGNDSLTVSQGNLSITVSAGKVSVSAGQAIELTVGANSLKIDTTSLTATVGGNSFKMDPGGITLSGAPEVKLSGAAMVEISGAMVKIN